MKKICSLIGVACLAAFTLQAAEEIHSNVPLTEAVPIPGSTATVVTHIDLTHGNWMISGLINFYESAERGTVFVGAAILVDAVTISPDGTTLFDSLQLDQATNVVLGCGLPSRLVKVPPHAGGGTTPINLVGFSVQPPNGAPNCIAWGFISAQKLDDD